ncbi:Na+/H+ antiporter subunit E [Anaerobaca lacustris]|uniref:Na+/H+ antiporter subunit E n=1 Tax=Anaerobaca lacustris TaxID=3044600 RepID=A0AAW6U7M1_9BACT|nr:Na+/H+ antiporter subunit E [Sedimentisphaerales bacterium M17dextr]
MRRVIYFVLAFIVWVLIAWPFADGRIDLQIVVAGLIVSFLVAVLFHDILPREHHVFISPVRVFWFLVYVPVFFYHVIWANLDVVYRAVHPAMPIRPGIVKIKTRLKTDSAITALANSITLTPGTLTVDLTDDGDLYVHWINVRTDDVEKATQLISQRFEWFLHRIFE